MNKKKKTSAKKRSNCIMCLASPWNLASLPLCPVQDSQIILWKEFQIEMLLMVQPWMFSRAWNALQLKLVLVISLMAWAQYYREKDRDLMFITCAKSHCFFLLLGRRLRQRVWTCGQLLFCFDLSVLFCSKTVVGVEAPLDKICCQEYGQPVQHWRCYAIPEQFKEHVFNS